MSEQAVDMSVTARGSLRVGDVLGRSFSVFGRHFLLFVVITAVVTAPNLFFSMKFAGVAAAQQATPGTILPGFWSLMLESAVVGLALYALSQAMVLHGAFQDMLGRPVSLRESMNRVAARLVPLILTLICLYVVVVLGMILLIVPGIMVAIMAAVASFWRSVELTKGSRWKIFAAFMVPAMVGGGVNFALRKLAGIAVGPEWAVLVTFPLAAALTSFLSVLSVVIYHDLRVAKEGHYTDQIAAVFD